MGFFEVPPLPEINRGARIHELVYPSLPRPGRELGVVIALNRLLFRSDECAALIPSVTVFSNGFSFELWIKTRQESGGMPTIGFHASRALLSQLDEQGRLLPHVLRFGWLFSDGSRVTNIDPIPTFLSAGKYAFVPGGGSGGGSESHHRFFVTPLPPRGPMHFVIEWPQHGVVETRTEIDTDEMLRAAENAAPLWPPTQQDAGEAEVDEKEAVLLAAVIHALGPAIIARRGVQTRGVRLRGHHPDTELVVNFQIVFDGTAHTRSFAIWRGANNLEIRRPQEVAADIAAEILGSADEP